MKTPTKDKAVQAAKEILETWSVGSFSQFCDEPADFDSAAVEEIAEVIRRYCGIEVCYECAASSLAQWVKAYGKEHLGVNRATGHCRNCRHRFRAEDSYFPDEGAYSSAVRVDEIQSCPAWSKHYQNNKDNEITTPFNRPHENYNIS